MLNDVPYPNGLTALENQLTKERIFPTLKDQLHIQPGNVSVSGLNENDYPSLSNAIETNIRVVKTSALPLHLQERTKEMKQNCLMGVFPEIDRIWMTVDNNLFSWNYESGSDPEYYDDFSDTILAVGFITPKPGVFHPKIHYLLCLAGRVEISVLGATVSGFRNNLFELIREPLFKISTDNEQITVVEDVNGRIIFGTKSGNILEISYWSEKPSWFRLTRPALSCNQKYCFNNDSRVHAKLINHSSWKLSVLLPSMLINAFLMNETIVQIVSDPTRNVIYTRSENSLIAQYELLPNDGLRSVGYITEDSLVSKSSRIVKSVEKNQFRNIVQICPLGAGHGSLHLMAVTQSGVRMYFMDNMILCHIRMPPASPSSNFGKISNVRLCCESRNSVLMVCGTSVDSQALYTICPDSFFVNALLETVSVTWANSGAWVLLPLDKSNDASVVHRRYESCPVVQTQHLDPMRRFIMVSADSISVLELPSPIHLFRSLLEKNASPISADMRAWIAHYGPEETMYAALVLASDHRKNGAQLASRAVDVVMHLLNEAVKYRTVTQVQPQQLVPPSIESANPLHQVLCMYAARILRPLWDGCIGERGRIATDDQAVTSTHDRDELGWFMEQLVYLNDFIRDQYSRIRPIDKALLPGACPELALELLELVKMTVEIVGLWRLLAEHPVPDVVRLMPADIQQELCRCSVRQLLLPGRRPILVAVISSLLEHYLSDGSSTEEIVRALYETCPSIYRREDVLCSQANELLIRVASLPPPTVAATAAETDALRERLLIESVRLFEQVGHSIDLRSVVGQLCMVGCAWGAIDLCLQAAHARDPDGLAFVCMRDNRRPHSTAEMDAVAGRNDAYKYMLDCLTNLLQQPQPSTDLHAILHSVFEGRRDDVMAHREVFAWLMDNDMEDEVLASGSSHLEAYLLQRIADDPSVAIRPRQLLWRHYERQGRLMDAARVLDGMAVAECGEYGLDDRLESLSRAVVLAKASMGGGGADFESDYVKELEDKMAIANLQRQIIDELGPDHPNVASELNTRLYPVLQLLTEFAEPYDLTVSKLLILKVSGHHDRDDVRLIWEAFLEREMERLTDAHSLTVKETDLRQTVSSVIRQFRSSPSYLALDTIIHHLEEYCGRYEFPDGWVVDLLLEADVAISDVLAAYYELIRNKTHRRSAHRLFFSVACLVDRFLHCHQTGSVRDLRVNCNLCMDVVVICLNHLQSRGDAASSAAIMQRLSVLKSLLDKRI